MQKLHGFGKQNFKGCFVKNAKSAQTLMFIGLDLIFGVLFLRKNFTKLMATYSIPN